MSFFSTRIIRLNGIPHPVPCAFARALLVVCLLFFPIFCYQPSAKWFLGLLGTARSARGRACFLCSRIILLDVPLCSEAYGISLIRDLVERIRRLVAGPVTRVIL